MSKFFYRGTPDVMGKYGKQGYQPKNSVKLGTKANPLSLTVNSEERKLALEHTLSEHQLIGNIELNTDAQENISELEFALNKPTTQRFDETPERNDPCTCGSGKKYKKCCG
ncbi:PBPRA1643 family SWIM/SEC-C metal-binding motif protein [Thalassotalea piscium]|uniref:SWIM/SEC-C metal-binding protein n=1 Tax=Thalassotalea piscium TaxID=1230533 RepID=A0A7X0NHH5_9GAMM|nr:PBPRA1643 family SWIM/SEC-C metal-binding motif protein [Thalassotalea piscium]MBB6543411.1 SWIM/SEC-C metal-binding protein [Thalassotalea piscium]